METKYFLRYRCFYLSDLTLVLRALTKGLVSRKSNRPQAFLNASSTQIHANSWEDVMDVIDVNGDGFISIEELERWPPDPEQITEHKMANAT